MNTQPRVLIVDDDAMVRLLARKALEARGLRVDEAANGRLGLEAYERQPPDLILLDVMMPELDGFQVCQAIRAHPAGRTTPILMLTGLDDVESIDRAINVGATDFATKPLNWRLLGQRATYLLRAARDRERLARSQIQLARAQRLAQLGSWEADAASRSIALSEESQRILGFPGRDQVSQEEMMTRVVAEEREAISQRFRAAFLAGETLNMDVRIDLGGGRTRVVHVDAEPAQEPGANSVQTFIGSIQDITERRQAEERIRRLAYFDALTGLPNRQHFRERLGRAIHKARVEGGQVALLLLDLDNFKLINDSLGHSAGDELLREVTHRLSRRLRHADPVDFPREEQGAMSRLGGDEFTVIISDLRGQADAEGVAIRLLDELSRPIPLEGREVVISASIGIALFPDHGADVEDLSRNADAAMYRAKALGRNVFHIYSDSLNREVARRLNTEHDIRQALTCGEFVLYYQPQLDMSSGEISGVEALIRWRHPKRGMVSPAEFIPIAEEAGLITRIGDWALMEACHQARAWLDEGVELGMAVNVSARQFAGDQLSRGVQRALRSSGLPPHLLELELTESTIMGDTRRAARSLAELRGLGIRVAIDDFGTGHSSLSKLRSLPVDCLKIDRTFVQEVHEDSQSAAIVESIINLGRGLGHTVVAEGVELIEQLNFLRDRGCHVAQGYYISEPKEARCLANLLTSSRASRAG